MHKMIKLEIKNYKLVSLTAINLVTAMTEWGQKPNYVKVKESFPQKLCKFIQKIKSKKMMSNDFAMYHVNCQ